jgi:lipopolysaccharide export system permease protein
MDSINDRKNDQHLNLFATTQNQIFNYHFKKDTVPMPADLAAHKRKRDSLARLKNNTTLPGKMTKENALAENTLPTIKVPTIKNETAIMPAENKPKRFSRSSKSTVNAKMKAEAVARDSTVFQIKVDTKLTTTENSYSALNDSIKAVIQAKSDSVFAAPPNRTEIATALNYIRSIKSQMVNYENQINNYDSEFKIYQVQWHKILSNSLACIVMFLIGAPLGAIIKRGGLGVPVLASILFFIVFYILSMMGDKWSRQGIIPVPAGIWAADAILFVIGLIFLRQARLDARLFEADFYNVVWDKLKIWLRSKKLLSEEVT